MRHHIEPDSASRYARMQEPSDYRAHRASCRSTLQRTTNRSPWGPCLSPCSKPGSFFETGYHSRALWLIPGCLKLQDPTACRRWRRVVNAHNKRTAHKKLLLCRRRREAIASPCAHNKLERSSNNSAIGIVQSVCNLMSGIQWFSCAPAAREQSL